MRLFSYEGYKIVISEEAFALKPFKKIWQRDRTVNKDKAIMELGYIYFMCDPRSDYQMYIDEEVRSREIKEGEGLDSKWTPDAEVKEAMKFYTKFQPASSLLLQDTRLMVDKYRQKMRSIDFEDLDVRELKDMSTLIKGIPGLVKDLDEAEKAVTREIVQSDSVRGSQEMHMFENL